MEKKWVSLCLKGSPSENIVGRVLCRIMEGGTDGIFTKNLDLGILKLHSP